MEFCHIWRLDPLPSSCKILFSGGAMGSGLNYPQRGRSLTLVGIEVLVVGADLHNELWIE